jgi:hypothetical protein
LAAEQQGDLFGLLTFTDKVERFVRAKNGKHTTALVVMRSTLEPQVVTLILTSLRLYSSAAATPGVAGFSDGPDDPVLAESFLQPGSDPPTASRVGQHAAT